MHSAAGACRCVRINNATASLWLHVCTPVVKYCCVRVQLARRCRMLAPFMLASISLCNARAQLSELEAKGKVLPASSSDYKVVQKIADRVIKAVEAGRGGGFQDHVSKCALPLILEP